MMHEFKIYDEPELVAQAAADYLYQRITACVADKGICHVVLPGGSTPARCLELLSTKSLPWKSIHWYPGDERCYPIGHAERNDTMIRAKLFSQPLTSQLSSSLPDISQPHLLSTDTSKNFHPIPAELGPEQGAEIYAALLDAILFDATLSSSKAGMDIVVLGMGEDGHTASLFPGNIALENKHSVVPVYGAPKPPGERVSMGLNTLKNAGECIIIATGEGKREAIKKIKSGAESTSAALPAALVKADVWFVDRDAIGEAEKI